MNDKSVPLASAFMGPYKIKEYITGEESLMKCECGKTYFSTMGMLDHLRYDHELPASLSHMCWWNREKVNNGPKNEER